MPGFILHAGASVLCAHSGQAVAVAPEPRVRLGGQPAMTMHSPCAVAGCPLPMPPSAAGACTTLTWLTGSTRVLANGRPVVVQDSVGVTAPSGAPALIVAMQQRVAAR